MRVRLIAAVVGLMVLAPSLGASGRLSPGVVIETEIRDLRRNTTQKMTASIEGNLLKVDVPGDGGRSPNAMIFRGDRQELLAIDHGRRSYIVLDQAEMKALSAQIGQAMSQMQQMLQDLPPERRAAAEAMMRGRGMAGTAPEPFELRRTEDRAEHSGYATVKYDVLRGGRKVRELWVTDWANTL